MYTLTQEDTENMAAEMADKVQRRITRNITIRAERATFPLFNISTRLVGGIRFLKIGRFCFSFCVTREYSGASNMFTVTYDIVTPESAEHGDNAESGFVLPGNWQVPIETVLADKEGTYTMSLHDAVNLTGNCLMDVGSWFQGDEQPDYRTGAVTNYSLHPPRNITRASYARLKRVLRAY